VTEPIVVPFPFQVKEDQMTRIEKDLRFSDKKFKRQVGTTKHVFQTMLEILQTAYDTLHKSGGKPNDLTVGDKLLVFLKYYREYTTMESIADDYHCHKSSVCRSIQWVEDTCYVQSSSVQSSTPKKCEKVMQQV
jgi:hypothetical protein